MKKTFSLVLTAFFLFLLFIPVFSSGIPYVVDDAGIISAGVRRELENELQRISDHYGLDIVVLTVYTLGNKNAEDFADDYYDEKGYGQGTEKSGILFLLSLEERDWYVSTGGFGITVFDDDTIDYVFGRMRSYLSRNDFDSAFREFVSACEAALSGYENGSPVGNGKGSEGGFSVKPAGVVLSLIAGFLLSLIPMATLKKQINNISYDNTANNYTRSNSVKIRDSRDIFLYAHTNKVPIPRETSSGSRGGGGVHVSSSGASHGGHGGKF